MLTKIFPEIPSETARLARSLFNERNLYLLVGDALCTISADFGEAPCCSESALAEQSVRLLAIITIFQYIEMLTDHQANEAIRQRLDWKYALHLPVTFPSAPYLQTCAFRRHLLAHPDMMAAFQAMLTRMKRLGMPAATPTTPTGSLASAEHVVRTVCAVNRLDRLVSAFLAALEYLAIYHTTWLRQNSQPGWILRYRRDTSLRALPVAPAEWPARFEMIGNDGRRLLDAIRAAPALPEDPDPMSSAPQVRALERELHRQFFDPYGRMQLRIDACSQCELTHSGT